MIAEGDMLAVRGAVRGTQRPVCGYSAYRPAAESGGNGFYPIADGRISRFLMQADSKALVDQLTR